MHVVSRSLPSPKIPLLDLLKTGKSFRATMDYSQLNNCMAKEIAALGIGIRNVTKKMPNLNCWINQCTVYP